MLVTHEGPCWISHFAVSAANASQNAQEVELDISDQIWALDVRQVGCEFSGLF